MSRREILDHATATEVMDLFMNYLTEHDAGMILVTHDEALAARCDHIYRMVDGTLVQGK